MKREMYVVYEKEGEYSIKFDPRWNSLVYDNYSVDAFKTFEEARFEALNFIAIDRTRLDDSEDRITWMKEGEA